MAGTRYTIKIRTLPDGLSKGQVSDFLKGDLKLADDRVSEIVGSLPSTVAEGLDEAEANRIRQALEWCGAQASMEAAPGEEDDEDRGDAAEATPGPIDGAEDEAPGGAAASPKDEPEGGDALADGSVEPVAKPGEEPVQTPLAPPADAQAAGHAPRARTGLTPATRAESRVERLKRTIASSWATSAGPPDPAPNISPEAPPRLPTSGPPVGKLGCIGAVVAVALVVIVVSLFDRDGAPPADDGSQQADSGSGSKAAGREDAETSVAKSMHADHLAKGKQAEADGQLTQALASYERAAESASTEESTRAISRVREKIDQDQLAKEHLARVAELKRALPQLEAQQDWAGQAACLEELQKLQGATPEMRKRLALAKLCAQEAALANQTQSIGSSKQAKAAESLQQARAFLQRGMYSQAADAARNVLMLQAGNQDAHQILSQCVGAAPALAIRRTRLPQRTLSKSLLLPEPKTPPVAVRKEPTRQPDGVAPVRKPDLPKAPEPTPRPEPEPKPEPKPKILWPQARGDTWHYRSAGNPDLLITRTVVGPKLVAGRQCVQLEETQLGDTQAVQPPKMLVLSLLDDGLYELASSGEFVKLYQLPMAVGQSFAYATPGIKTAGVIAQPAEVTAKTERRETVETPAGTFDCFVVTRTSQRKNFLLKSRQIVSVTETSTEWVCPGVGLVKQQVEQVEEIVKGEREVARSTIELTHYKAAQK